MTVTSAAMPIVRSAMVRYTGSDQSEPKASSDQLNGMTAPVNSSLAQNALSSRMNSDPR